MKTKQIPQSRNAINNTRVKVSRTKSVRKRLAGSPKKRQIRLSPSVGDDLKLALDFGEAMLGSAILLSDRLNQLAADPSTRTIRETLRLAQANFDALRARVSGFQAGGGL